MQKLSAQIDVTTGDSSSRLQVLEARLKRLQNIAANAATGPQKFAQSLALIKRTGAEISALKSVGTQFNQIPRSSGQATQALVNFNRVVQDSPFGIIGIANNIDPLIQSFTALKQSTGSTGGALKALGASLLGPGGILFAFSALSTASILLVQEYGSLENALAAMIGDFDAATKANRALQQTFAEAQGSAAGEIAEIRALVKVANDETQSRKARQEAVNRLNKEYDEYLPNLTLETIGSEKAKTAIDNLTKSILRQAQIKGLQDLISKETQKQFEALNKNAIESASGLQKFAGVLNAFSTGNFTQAIGQVARAGDEKKRKDLDNTTEAIKRYIAELEKLIAVDTQDGPQTEVKVKGPKVNIEEPDLKPSIIRPQYEVIPSIAGNEIATDDLKKLNTEVASQINTEAAKNTFQPQYKIDAQFDISPTKQRLEEALKRLNDSINNALQNFRVDAIAGLGETIGRGIADGANGLLEGFKAIGQLFGGLLQRLGKIAIEYGVAALALQTAIKSFNPLAAIAAGVLLTALGSAVQAKLSVPAFANGGIVTGPTLGLIGEAGQPEVILPLNKLNQLMEGGSQNINVVGKIDGDSIRLLSERTTRRQNRNF